MKLFHISRVKCTEMLTHCLSHEFKSKEQKSENNNSASWTECIKII